MLDPESPARRDSETRAEHARAIAWRALDRRERTEAELRAVLARREVEADTIEQVVGELAEQGYLDDAGYARRFAEDRRRLDGWGAERIAERLRGLGVEGRHIDAALAERAESEELEAAIALLRRRQPEPARTPRERARALGLLVRRGYELELAHEAIRARSGPE